MSDFIADDRGMDELWEEIQKMSKEEKEKLIAEYEAQKLNEQN